MDPQESSKFNSWPYTGHPKNHTMSLRALTEYIQLSGFVL